MEKGEKRVMFTGIIEEIGRIKAISQGKLEIYGMKVLEDVKIGDSIAVNGVCLTVTAFRSNSFTVDVMPETFRKSSLGQLAVGGPVNLERAMAADGRFGGHIVAGHVDSTGVIDEMRQEGNAMWITITVPRPLQKYIVEKGSIAIDGVSLTVAELTSDGFRVSIIPHTGEETILLTKQCKSVVNLECDMIGKYVERLLGFQKSEVKGESPKLTLSFLEENGF